MANLREQLDLNRCPHCRVDRPSLPLLNKYETTDYSGGNKRYWGVYKCSRCGGIVTAAATAWNMEVIECNPKGVSIDPALPDKAKAYLEQALNSLHAPAGAVMLTASAVDAMLKAQGYKEGSLYNRIDKAAEEHVITTNMAMWAHEIRLEANEQRHADDSVSLPTEVEAKRCLDFAVALGQFMFVLPSRVEKGLEEAKQKT